MQINELIAPIVNDIRYTLSVNTIASIVTFVWELSERPNFWEAFCAAKKTVSTMGRGKLHSSRNSSLGIHSYDERLDRVRRRRRWNSTWVYGGRPTTFVLGATVSYSTTVF